MAGLPPYTGDTRIESLRVSDHIKLGELIEKNEIYKEIAHAFRLTMRTLREIEDHKIPTGERLLDVLADKNTNLTLDALKTKLKSVNNNAFQQILDLLDQWTCGNSSTFTSIKNNSVVPLNKHPSRPMQNEHNVMGKYPQPPEKPNAYCKEHNIHFSANCKDHLHNSDIQFNNDLGGKSTPNIEGKDNQDINNLHKIFRNMIEIESSNLEEVLQRCQDFLKKIKQNLQSKRAEEIKNHIFSFQRDVTQIQNKKIASLQASEKALKDLNTLLLENNFSENCIQAENSSYTLIQPQINESLNNLLNYIPKNLNFTIDSSEVLNIDFSDIANKQKAVSNEFATGCNTILHKLFKNFYQKATAQILKTPLINCDLILINSVKRTQIQAKETYDITHLPNDNILLSDFYNKALIQLDKNLNVLTSFPVESNPDGVCSSSDGKMVHVACNSNTVVTYIFDPWREIRRFKTEDRAFGIACHDDRIVTGQMDCVRIYDYTGRLVSRIQTSGETAYLAFSRDGRMLYYRDGANIICRSMEGMVEMWRYSSPHLKWPCGIDTDIDGNVLIIGETTGNIHQVMGDGRSPRELVKLKYIRRPVGLFCNHNNDTIVVVSAIESICIEMYKFKEPSLISHS